MSLTAQYVYHTLLCIYKSALFCHMDILETAIPRKYTSPILFATVFKKYAALDRIKGSFYSVHLRNLYLFSLCVPRLWTGEGNGTPLQYSCLENPMDGGAWQAAVHGVTKSRTRLRDFIFTFHFSLFTFMHWRRKWQPTPVFLPGESQGWGSLVGCHLWGRTESDMTEATQQQQQSPVDHILSDLSTMTHLSWVAPQGMAQFH